MGQPTDRASSAQSHTSARAAHTRATAVARQDRTSRALHAACCGCCCCTRLKSANDVVEPRLQAPRRACSSIFSPVAHVDRRIKHVVSEVCVACKNGRQGWLARSGEWYGRSAQRVAQKGRDRGALWACCTVSSTTVGKKVLTVVSFGTCCARAPSSCETGVGVVQRPHRCRIVVAVLFQVCTHGVDGRGDSVFRKSRLRQIDRFSQIWRRLETRRGTQPNRTTFIG